MTAVWGTCHSIRRFETLPVVKDPVVHGFAAPGVRLAWPEHSHFIRNHCFVGAEGCRADILTTMFISGGQKSQRKWDLSLVENDPPPHPKYITRQWEMKCLSMCSVYWEDAGGFVLGNGEAYLVLFFPSHQVETPCLLQLMTSIKFPVHKWCCTGCRWVEENVGSKVLPRIFKLPG